VGCDNDRWASRVPPRVAGADGSDFHSGGDGAVEDAAWGNPCDFA